jgi:hypothetical protein
VRLDGEEDDSETREDDEGEDTHGPTCGAQFVVRFKVRLVEENERDALKPIFGISRSSMMR